jgi:hypothetical protein
LIFPFWELLRNKSNIARIPRLHTRTTIQILFLLLGAILGIIFPMAIGILTGTRTGPDYRYHLLILISVELLIFFLAYNAPKLSKASLIVVSIAMIFGTASALEVRNRQHDLDLQVWDKVTRISDLQKIDAIVTYNPYTNYPMAPYHSFAESDFQADWGIGGKVYWLTRHRIPVFSNENCQNKKCLGTNYYGGVTDIQNLGRGKIIYVASLKNIEPQSISQSDFLVTDDYQTFIAFKNSHPKITQ